MSKVKKKIFVLVAIFFMIICVTNSRYFSVGSINTSTDIAKWAVKINGKDVNSSTTFTLDNIVWSEKEKVANGYVAPGGKGYFEVNIDTTGTRVAVDYTIGFDSTMLEENSRVRVEKVTFDDDEVISQNGYYDGFISLDDVLNDKIVNAKIYINWDESYNESDNLLDIKSVTDYGKIELPIVVTVKQHIDGVDQKKELITQLIPYKETLLQVERPKSGIIISPFYDAYLDALYKNPERGMYSSNNLTLEKTGNTIKNMKASVSNLLYLKVDLSAFSAWRNGKDEELSQNAIDTLRKQLENIKQNNNTVILRFVYDNNITSIYNDNKTKFEPEQNILLRHIEQLKPVFLEYTTTIYTIQIGFYGLWGESFYNTDVNSHPEYYKETMEALLEATKNTEITIAFRTIKYAKSAMKNSNYDTSRVGIYNDAYLSQNDDMGTFSNRSEDIIWLNSQNVSYGGEALPATYMNVAEETFAYGDGSKSVYEDVGGVDEYLAFLKKQTKNWDLISYTEDEMFKTHTSYVNFEWNQYKHYIWANQIYNGKDENYFGKTALDYIQSHLGYRLVLRNVDLPRMVSSSDEVNANIKIENVGFGNITKSKFATLLFVDTSNNIAGTVDITDDFDVKEFTSTNTVTKSLLFTLPELLSGTYKVFLRISNDEILNNGTYYSAIRLANNSIWDEMLQANCIGSIQVI